MRKVLLEAELPTEGISEYCESALQLPLTEKQWARLKAILAEILITIQSQSHLVECFRQLDTGGLLEEVTSPLLSLPIRAKELNFVLSVMLQYTDRLNFKILKFYSDHAEQLDPL